MHSQQLGRRDVVRRDDVAVHVVQEGICVTPVHRCCAFDAIALSKVASSDPVRQQHRVTLLCNERRSLLCLACFKRNQINRAFEYLREHDHGATAAQPL